jgi:hypothetical protein
MFDKKTIQEFIAYIVEKGLLLDDVSLDQCVDPRILKCGHSFGMKTIKDILKEPIKTAQLIDRGAPLTGVLTEKFCCPLCRTKIIGKKVIRKHARTYRDCKPYIFIVPIMRKYNNFWCHPFIKSNLSLRDIIYIKGKSKLSEADLCEIVQILRAGDKKDYKIQKLLIAWNDFLKEKELTWKVYLQNYINHFDQDEVTGKIFSTVLERMTILFGCNFQQKSDAVKKVLVAIDNKLHKNNLDIEGSVSFLCEISTTTNNHDEYINKILEYAIKNAKYDTFVNASKIIKAKHPQYSQADNHTKQLLRLLSTVTKVIFPHSKKHMLKPGVAYISYKKSHKVPIISFNPVVNCNSLRFSVTNQNNQKIINEIYNNLQTNNPLQKDEQKKLVDIVSSIIKNFINQQKSDPVELVKWLYKLGCAEFVNAAGYLDASSLFTQLLQDDRKIDLKVIIEIYNKSIILEQMLEQPEHFLKYMEKLNLFLCNNRDNEDNKKLFLRKEVEMVGKTTVSKEEKMLFFAKIIRWLEYKNYQYQIIVEEGRDKIKTKIQNNIISLFVESEPDYRKILKSYCDAFAIMKKVGKMSNDDRYCNSFFNGTLKELEHQRLYHGNNQLLLALISNFTIQEIKTTFGYDNLEELCDNIILNGMSTKNKIKVQKIIMRTGVPRLMKTARKIARSNIKIATNPTKAVCIEYILEGPYR